MRLMQRMEAVAARRPLSPRTLDAYRACGRRGIRARVQRRGAQNARGGAPFSGCVSIFNNYDRSLNTCDFTRNGCDFTRNACDRSRNACDFTRKDCDFSRKACDFTRNDCDCSRKDCDFTRNRPKPA